MRGLGRTVGIASAASSPGRCRRRRRRRTRSSSIEVESSRRDRCRRGRRGDGRGVVGGRRRRRRRGRGRRGVEVDEVVVDVPRGEVGAGADEDDDDGAGGAAAAVVLPGSGRPAAPAGPAEVARADEVAVLRGHLGDDPRDGGRRSGDGADSRAGGGWAPAPGRPSAPGSWSAGSPRGAGRTSVVVPGVASCARAAGGATHGRRSPGRTGPPSRPTARTPTYLQHTVETCEEAPPDPCTTATGGVHEHRRVDDLFEMILDRRHRTRSLLPERTSPVGRHWVLSAPHLPIHAIDVCNEAGEVTWFRRRPSSAARG